MTQRHIAFDTETTGLDPAAGHRVVEIGCVEMLDYIRTGRTFHTYLNPQRDMPPDAQRIHGLSSAFLNDKPTFAQIAQDFLDFVGDGLLVAHNASFDLKFINHELRAVGLPVFPEKQSLDTVMMARSKYPGQPASLDALCRRFNIDLSARTQHGALLDAELLSDVYLEMMGGRQASLLLQKETHIPYENKADGISVATFPRRHFSPTDAELAAHAAFIAKHMKQSLWNEKTA